jgi:hypothetical protein
MDDINESDLHGFAAMALVGVMMRPNSQRQPHEVLVKEAFAVGEAMAKRAALLRREREKKQEAYEERERRRDTSAAPAPVDRTTTAGGV